MIVKDFLNVVKKNDILSFNFFNSSGDKSIELSFIDTNLLFDTLIVEVQEVIIKNNNYNIVFTDSDFEYVKSIYSQKVVEKTRNFMTARTKSHFIAQDITVMLFKNGLVLDVGTYKEIRKKIQEIVYQHIYNWWKGRN